MLYGSGVKKKVERRRRQRKFPYERFKRVGATIQLQDTSDLLEARVFLHDLTPDGVGLFIREELRRGDLVSLAIDIDDGKQLYIKGEIAWCQPWTLETRVLRCDSYPYRAGIKFRFDDIREKNAIIEYCGRIAVRVAA